MIQPRRNRHVVSDDSEPSLVVERPWWHADAACRGKGGAGLNKFFPDNNSAGRTARDIAEAYCWRCPVRVECEQAGQSERYGVWGGRLRAFGWRKARMDRAS